MFLDMFACVYVCLCLCVYLNMFLWFGVCVCVCVCMCVCVCVYGLIVYCSFFSCSEYRLNIMKTIGKIVCFVCACGTCPFALE